MQVGATVGHAERSGDLRRFIEQGKKIIVSTVQKFPSSSTRSPPRRQDLRHRHRRGAFEPGRQDLGGDEPGARRAGGDDDARPDPEDTVNARSKSAWRRARC
jgi:type I restriction enzyme R subunit